MTASPDQFPLYPGMNQPPAAHLTHTFASSADTAAELAKEAAAEAVLDEQFSHPLPADPDAPSRIEQFLDVRFDGSTFDQARTYPIDTAIIAANRFGYKQPGTGKGPDWFNKNPNATKNLNDIPEKR